MRRFSLLVLFLFIGQISLAKFAFNDNCIKAYDDILSMRLNEGQALLEVEKKTNPSNAIPIFLENYIDFLKVLTTETREGFEELKQHKVERIELLQKEDKGSPYYLYCQAEINLQSCINRFKFQEFVSGAYELQKAYKQLEENQKKFPEFLPNQKSLGLLYALIGMVPDNYKWALSTIGLKGNVQQGMVMLEKLKDKLPNSSYAQFQNETIFFLSMVQMSVENLDDIYGKVIKNTSTISNNNLMNVYIRSVAAIRTGHSDDAISYLNSRPKSTGYAPFYYLDYLMGLAKLSRMDANANEPFDYYIKNYTGSFNVKDSYLKLAWFYLLNGDVNKYKAYIAACKIRGQAISEKDKEALNQANNTFIPNAILLKARLYFDGGYYDRALALLKDKKPENFNVYKEKLELTYRLGRVNDALGKFDQAIQFYTSTISSGIEYPYYFAANSSLLLGYIFENRKQYDKAKYYYSLSMKMKNQEYKNSIETKAKAGLKRLPN